MFFYTNAHSVIGIEKVYKDEIYINSERICKRQKKKTFICAFLYQQKRTLMSLY